MIDGPTTEPFFTHSDLEVVYPNPDFCALVGAETAAELIGTSVIDLVTSEYESSLRERVGRLESGAEPATGLRVALRTSAGHSRRVILVSSLVERDGTDLVQTSVFPIAETGLGSGRLLSDRTVNEAPIGITVSDPSRPDNPLIHVNKGFCEQTGYDREDVLGRNCRFLQGEDTREEPVSRMREAIDAEESVTVELRNYQKDGSMFWNRVTITPVKDDSGTVTNFIGYQQDISAAKRYEQHLSLFKIQAANSEKAILITDRDGAIQYVNPAFERVNGYTPTEVIGRTPRVLKSNQQDDEFYEALWETITGGDAWEAELVNRTKYGELYEARHTITPVTDENGTITHYVGIAEDITEDVLTGQRLGVMNRVMRHNLRNAINVIDGHAELLETSDPDPETRKASLAAIRRQAASMQKIGDMTTKIRSIWSGSERRLTWEPLDLELLAGRYRRRFPEANVTCEVADAVDVRVRSPELVEKALDEAVANAIEHADQPEPEVTVTIRRAPDTDGLRITVADNGPGIPELERQAIKSGEETPLGHSLGIGLWVMEWITTTLGGQLTITDNEPRGSVVTFRLPASYSQEK